MNHYETYLRFGTTAGPGWVKPVPQGRPVVSPAVSLPTSRCNVYTPTKLNRWKRPECYFGAEWPDYYGSGFGRTRDSDALERANFDAAYAALEQLDTDREGESTVQLVTENHWACGWVEWIAIHESNESALRKADELREAYEQYPVVSESIWSEYEDEECASTWERCFDASERIDYLRRHSYTAGNFGQLLRAVRGDWGEASSILHFPSDLI